MKTFLNLTAYTPQMTFALCAFLERRDGEEDEETMRSWLAPPSLFARGRPPEDWGYGYAVEVAEHLDLIERANGKLKLTESINGSLQLFRVLVRERLMDKSGRSSVRSEDPTDELTGALAWWLHLPPQVLTSKTFERYMDGLPIKPILQPTRWMVFERWTLFLGFGWRFSDGLLPDPTSAVGDTIDRVIKRGETLAAPEFVDRLAAELPVVDRGKAFARYRKQVGLKAPSDVLGAPLSLTLLRLADRGELDFPPLKDVAGVTIKCGHLERRIASVHRTGAPKSGRAT